jgi:hypothetical protein
MFLVGQETAKVVGRVNPMDATINSSRTTQNPSPHQPLMMEKNIVPNVAHLIHIL